MHHAGDDDALSVGVNDDGRRAGAADRGDDDYWRDPDDERAAGVFDCAAVAFSHVVESPEDAWDARKTSAKTQRRAVSGPSE